MATPSIYQPPPPPPPPPAAKSNLPMLYYGLIVVGTAAIVLALYNIIVIRLCSDRRSQLPQPRPNSSLIEVSRTSSRAGFEDRALPSSFKYKKEKAAMTAAAAAEADSECAVCLSAFEEGEEIRNLPRCKHSFHAPCIDMWLYSHSDCPLCRAPVVVSGAGRCHRHVTSPPEENSREVLLNSTVPV
ncbi:43kDa postsynaptic protein [Trema orientale]|uniref:RING-type E3 ubiquitin transferase n=1 Tax=Trema orientale TaxID=63057 RepID=A0A2P5BGX5_TREOI|nr:43kDa postsynaptic protein [Trema orientale]